MGFLIALLTVFLVLDCLVLILLVLMQLPKKEAGAGLAFGGAATDALFGAGSGNFLTKATKYAAGIFFAFAIILSVLENQKVHQRSSDFEQQLQQQQKNQAGPGQPMAAPNSAPTTPAAATAPAGAHPAAVPATTNFSILPPPGTGTQPAAPTNAAPAPK